MTLEENVIDKPKPQRIGRRSSPDTLSRASEKGEIALKEEDLKKVTGGTYAKVETS